MHIALHDACRHMLGLIGSIANSSLCPLFNSQHNSQHYSNILCYVIRLSCLPSAHGSCSCPVHRTALHSCHIDKNCIAVWRCLHCNSANCLGMMLLSECDAYWVHVNQQVMLSYQLGSGLQSKTHFTAGTQHQQQSPADHTASSPWCWKRPPKSDSAPA